MSFFALSLKDQIDQFIYALNIQPNDMIALVVCPNKVEGTKIKADFSAAFPSYIIPASDISSELTMWRDVGRTQDHNIFFRRAPIIKGVKTPPKFIKDSEVYVPRSLFVDIDEDVAGDKADRVEELCGPAAVRVSSGGGTHLYYDVPTGFVTEGADNELRAPFEEALRLLSDRITIEKGRDGGNRSYIDTAVSNLARLSRIPGFLNPKRDVMCKIQTFRGNVDDFPFHTEKLLELKKKDIEEAERLKTEQQQPKTVSGVIEDHSGSSGKKHWRKRPNPFVPKPPNPSLKLESVLDDLFPCSRAFVGSGVSDGWHEYRLSLGRELLGLGLPIEEAKDAFIKCGDFNERKTIKHLKTTERYLQRPNPRSPWGCIKVQNSGILQILCKQSGVDVCGECVKAIKATTEDVSANGGKCCEEFSCLKFSLTNAEGYYYDRLVPILPHLVRLIDPWQNGHEHWENTDNKKKWYDKGAIMRLILSRAGDIWRAQAARPLEDYLDAQEPEVFPMFKDCPQIIDPITRKWGWPGELADQGERMTQDPEKITTLREVILALPTQAFTILSLCIANTFRFWLMHKKDPKVGLIPHILLLGNKAMGKTVHASYIMRQTGGCEGNEQDLGGTGVRFFSLIDDIPCGTGPIFIDEVEKVKGRIIAIAKEIPVVAWKKYRRGSKDLSMTYWYIASSLILTSNVITLFDDATIDRFYIFVFNTKLAEEIPDNLYIKLSANDLISLIAHMANTRWELIEDNWNATRTGERDEDKRLLAEFGARLIYRALKIESPFQFEFSDPPTTPLPFKQRRKINELVRPLSTKEAGEELTTTRGSNVALAIDKLLSRPILSGADIRVKIPLSFAVATGDFQEAESDRLATLGVVIDPVEGSASHFRLMVESRWCKKCGLTLRELATYLETDFEAKTSSHYGRRRRVIIPIEREMTFEPEDS